MGIPLSRIHIEHDFLRDCNKLVIRNSCESFVVEIFDWRTPRSVAANILMFDVAREMYRVGREEMQVLKALRLRLLAWCDDFDIDVMRIQLSMLDRVKELLLSWQLNIANHMK